VAFPGIPQNISPISCRSSPWRIQGGVKAVIVPPSAMKHSFSWISAVAIAPESKRFNQKI